MTITLKIIRQVFLPPGHKDNFMNYSSAYYLRIFVDNGRSSLLMVSILFVA